MTANKPMTGEQLDELMTVAVNMQRDSEKAGDRPAAMFAYAVQVAVLELRKVRDDAAALAAESAGLKDFVNPVSVLRLMAHHLTVLIFRSLANVLACLDGKPINLHCTVTSVAMRLEKTPSTS
jgi:hypothetical protein